MCHVQELDVCGEPSARYLSDCAEEIWKFWAVWGNLYELLYLNSGVLA